MGVGLYLNGRFAPDKKKKDPARHWLKDIAEWFAEDVAGDPFWGNFFTRSRHGITHDDKPALFVSIHPAAEQVEFIVPRPGHVLVAAKTSTVGPGYHTALCQLMHTFSEALSVEWHPEGETDDACQDETGYFFHGDRQAVEREMLAHLRTLARISLETRAAPGSTLEAWHMPLGHSYSEYPGAIRTPLGVRSEAWIQGVLDDPRRGIDIYPWWEDGVGPAFYLGRALCDLWSKVRWRSVLVDEEYDEWDCIHHDLCEAYEANPNLAYPWREWGELIDILDDFEGASMVSRDISDEVRERAAGVPAAQPLIGYRRYPVRVDLLDGWSLRIPGEMAEQWDDANWSAWDLERTVWFTNWGISAADGAPVSAQEALQAMNLREGKVIDHRRGDLIGKAILCETEENGERLQNLQAYSAVTGKAALCNIFYRDPKDCDWAVATWHSMIATG